MSLLRQRAADAAAHATSRALEAQLARGGRATKDWLQAIRTIGDTNYRIAAPDRKTLLRVATDVGADESARVGALVALAPDLTKRERVRIATLKDASLSPSLQAAIEAVETNRIADLEASLADEEDASTRA